MQRIVRTWLTLSPEDSCWFDTENIYNLVKTDLVNKLRSFSFGSHHDFIGIFYDTFHFNFSLCKFSSFSQTDQLIISRILAHISTLSWIVGCSIKWKHSKILISCPSFAIFLYGMSLPTYVLLFRSILFHY